MVNIHNIMEEQVIIRVNELYERIKNEGNTWLECDCENCRLDAYTYVLNRIQPRYVVSGRGMTYNSTEIHSDRQLMVDLDRLGIEAIRMVNSAKRPYHNKAKLNASGDWETMLPTFTVPTFIGSIFDGTTFEPLKDARVTLKTSNGDLATMMDVSWSNPCSTFEKTSGRYSFWVAPEASLKPNEKKDFSFTVEIECEGYDPVFYAFTIPLVSRIEDPHKLDSTLTYRIQDLRLFKHGLKNELE